MTYIINNIKNGDFDPSERGGSGFGDLLYIYREFMYSFPQTPRGSLTDPLFGNFRPKLVKLAHNRNIIWLEGMKELKSGDSG